MTIPEGRTPCTCTRVVPACCRFPQKPWLGVVPPAPEIGQWRHEDPSQPAFRREGPAFCHVRREIGEGVFEVDLYNDQVLMVASHRWGARRVMELWPEVLPGKPTRPDPANPAPVPAAPAAADPVELPATPIPPARRPGYRASYALVAVALLAAAGGLGIGDPPSRR
jgi:hypothetical protein